MRLIPLLVLSLMFGCGPAYTEDIFEKYLWQKRVLLVFAPSLEDPRYQEQQQQLSEHSEANQDRDMVFWSFIYGEYVIAEEELRPHLAASRFYEDFDVPYDGFTVILLGKDGEEKLRKTDQILKADELFTLIDTMPMRQREMRKSP